MLCILHKNDRNRFVHDSDHTPKIGSCLLCTLCATGQLPTLSFIPIFFLKEKARYPKKNILFLERKLTKKYSLVKKIIRMLIKFKSCTSPVHGFLGKSVQVIGFLAQISAINEPLKFVPAYCSHDFNSPKMLADSCSVDYF